MNNQSKIKQKNKSYLKKSLQLYSMLCIPVLYFVIFKYLPMRGTIIAFKDYNIFKSMWECDWVGLAHFKEAFGTVDFWNAIVNTLVLNLGDLLIGFPIPILLAILLNELNSNKIKKSAQMIMYLPHFLSWVIIAGVVQQIFSNTGMVNQMITSLGFEAVGFMSNPKMWRILYWATGVWQSAGYSLIIYLAALTALDPALAEAAYIDGAGRMKRIRYITLPLIRPTISMMLIMNLGKIMAISFDRPYMLGNVLVKDASNVISTHVYNLGIKTGRYDFATAIGLFQSVVGLILILTANKLAQKFGEEGIL